MKRVALATAATIGVAAVIGIGSSAYANGAGYGPRCGYYSQVYLPAYGGYVSEFNYDPRYCGQRPRERRAVRPAYGATR